VKTVNSFRCLGLASILAGVLIPLDSCAQTAANPSRGPVPFEIYDADGDGAISVEEFNAVQEQRMAGKPGAGMGAPGFSGFDSDGDGRLTREELEAGQQANRARRAGGGEQGYRMKNLGSMPSFGDIDTDGNGVISPDEFAGHQLRHRSQ